MQPILNFIKAREAQNPERYAIIYTITGTVCHATTHSIFKWAQLPVFQALADRGLLTILILYMKNPNQDYYPKAQLWTIVLFGFLIALGTGFYFESLKLIALSEATIIYQTNTIWAQIAALFILKNHTISLQMLLNTLISFVGIVFIARPKFDSEAASVLHLLGCILGLFSAIFQSTAYTVLKLVGDKVSSEVTTLYFHVFMIIISQFMQLYTQEYRFTSDYYISICCCVLASMGGHILYFRSMQMVSYNKLANYTYTFPLITLLIDIFLFGMIPQIFSVIGGGLILFSIFRQLRQNQ